MIGGKGKNNARNHVKEGGKEKFLQTKKPFGRGKRFGVSRPNGVGEELIKKQIWRGRSGG